jgi:hypothetical protein
MASAHAILTLGATSSLRATDIALPGVGSIKWVGWLTDRDRRVSINAESAGRLVIVLQENTSPREAQWVADTLAGLVDLIHGPSGMSYSILEIPLESVTEQKVDVEKLEATLQDSFLLPLSDYYFPTDGPIAEALRHLPSTLATGQGNHDRGLPAA